MSKRSINPWLTVAFCCLMQAFTVGISIYAFALFVIPWITEFETQRSTLMLATTGSSVAVAILSPIMGVLLDRLDTRKLILGSLFIFALGLVAIAAAPSEWVIIVAFSTALPIGIILAGPLMCYSLVAKTITHRRGLALGITALGTSVGGFAIPFLITYLLGNYDWRVVMVILAALIMVCVFVPALFVLVKSEIAPQSAGQHSEKLRLMRSRPVIYMGMCYLLPSTMFIAVLHNIGAYAADIGISQQEAGWVISACSIMMALGKLTSGAMSDRLNHLAMYTSIVVLICVGMVLTGIATSFTALLIGVSLVAMMTGGLAPLFANIVANRWGVEQFGSIMGVIHFFAALSATGSLAVAWVRDTTGSYSDGFIWINVLLIPAVILFITQPKVAPGEGDTSAAPASA